MEAIVVVPAGGCPLVGETLNGNLLSGALLTTR
jgi:hypothetical protein